MKRVAKGRVKSRVLWRYFHAGFDWTLQLRQLVELGRITSKRKEICVAS